jgi:MFS superfamily sulfate permease-like transporter
VLSAVVFLIGLRLIAPGAWASLRARRPVEFGVALVTAATVVLIGVGQGIAIAVAASIIAHLRHSYRPLNSLLVPTPEGAIRPVPLSEGRQALEGLIIYRFGADLYFANEKRFIEEAEYRQMSNHRTLVTQRNLSVSGQLLRILNWQ